MLCKRPALTFIALVVLTISAEGTAGHRGQLRAQDCHHVVVYYVAGHQAMVPANVGIWNWADEILTGFVVSHFEKKWGDHSVDRSRPGPPRQMARSEDGGESWICTADNVPTTAPIDCPGGMNFAHPDLMIRFARDRFFVSYDRGQTYEAVYKLPNCHGRTLTSRTSYIVNGKDDCWMFLSTREPKVSTVKWLQDRSFCVRTTDGGKTFDCLGWMTDEPKEVRAVMPSVVRAGENHLVATLRRRYDFDVKSFEISHNWIDAYESEDGGVTWELLSKVADTDAGNELSKNGNPPSLVRLDDGRLVVTYVYRSEPYSLRARISGDFGATWGPEVFLRDDGITWDGGYSRSVKRSDGKVVTVYYFATAERREPHIEATIWDPDSVCP